MASAPTTDRTREQAADSPRLAAALSTLGARLARAAMTPLALAIWPALVVLALTGWAIVHGQIPYPSAQYAFMDENQYMAMAMHPFSSDPLVHEAPFTWRLLSPLVVHVLPLPAKAGFLLLTVVSLAGAAYALAWFLRGLGFGLPSATAGAIAFLLLGPATGFTLWDYMLNDPLSLALLALALACSVQRRGALLAVVLVLGAANKEANMLAAVFAVAWALQQKDRRMLAWAAGGGAAALALLIALRLLLPAARSYSWLGQFEMIYGAYTPIMVRARLYDITAFTWILLLPFAALQLIHPPYVWRWPAFALVLLGATAQVLVATDAERVVVYAFPAVIAATAFEVRYLAQRFRVSQAWLWGPLLLFELWWWFVTYGARTDGTIYRAFDPKYNLVVKLIAPLAVIAVGGFLYWDRVATRVRPAAAADAGDRHEAGERPAARAGAKQEGRRG